MARRDALSDSEESSSDSGAAAHLRPRRRPGPACPIGHAAELRRPPRRRPPFRCQGTGRLEHGQRDAGSAARDGPEREPAPAPTAAVREQGPPKKPLMSASFKAFKRTPSGRDPATAQPRQRRPPR